MGIVVAVLVMVAFVALLVFLPADKFLKNTNSDNHERINSSHDKFKNELLFPDYIHDPKYSRMSGNIYHKD